MEDKNELFELMEDKRIAKLLDQHITFVEKYVLKVNEIDSKEEQEIIYKSLGAIVVSSIEALCNSLRLVIENKCKKKKCGEECQKSCKYIFRSKDYKKGIIGIIDYLCTVRLFGLNAGVRDQFIRLNDLRNYIHISKYMNEDKQKLIFNDKYVYSLLDMYYEFQFQYIMCSWFFNNKQNCLKVLDNDGVDFTKQSDQGEIDLYYTLKISEVVRNILYDKSSEDDMWYLNQLKNNSIKDKSDLIEMIDIDIRYYKGRRDSQSKIKKLLSILKNYSNDKEFIECINERIKKDVDNNTKY